MSWQGGANRQSTTILWIENKQTWHTLLRHSCTKHGQFTDCQIREGCNTPFTDYMHMQMAVIMNANWPQKESIIYITRTSVSALRHIVFANHTHTHARTYGWGWQLAEWNKAQMKRLMLIKSLHRRCAQDKQNAKKNEIKRSAAPTRVRCPTPNWTESKGQHNQLFIIDRIGSKAE